MEDRLPGLPSLNSRLDSSLDSARLLDPMWIVDPSLADWILREVFCWWGLGQEAARLV